MELKHYYLNAYEILLLQKILKIEFGYIGKELEYKHVKEITNSLVASSDLDKINHATIAKFFNKSHNENTPHFRDENILDTIINRLNLPNIPNWDIFRDTYKFKRSEGKPKREFIPIGHLSDFSDKRKKELIEEVFSTLTEIYSPKDLVGLKFDGSESYLDSVSDTMKSNYINTSWYMYYYYPFWKDPKIGRLILTIGDEPNQVIIKHHLAKNNTYFEGSVRFNYTQQFLIFSMRLNSKDKKDLLMLADVRSLAKPDIILGKYINIGLEYNSLSHGSFVMERISPEVDVSQMNATYFDARDQEFYDIDVGIREHLKYPEHQSEFYDRKVFSKSDLREIVDRIKNSEPRKIMEIRQSAKIVVAIKHPKFSIDFDQRSKYLKASERISECFEKHGFHVQKTPSESSGDKYAPSVSTSSYFQKVKDVEIMICFAFDRSLTNMFSEIAWGFGFQKRIFIFTDDIEQNLLRTYNFSDDSKIRIITMKTIDEAADWLVHNLEFLFRGEIEWMKLKK